MTNKDLNDDRKSADSRADDIPEARPGWKSKWVESTSPAADDPISAEEMQGHNYDGARLNPPELEEVPGDSGEEATAEP